MSSFAEEQREALEFVGETLGSLFLLDPLSDEAAPLLDALQQVDAADAAAAWPFVDAVQAQACLAGMTGDACAPAARQALAEGYRADFVGPNSLSAPPWGSVYTDRERVVFGATTLELRQWMRSNGVERLDGRRTPEDHIGLLMKMMSWLAQCRPELVGTFLEQHVLCWAPHYLAQLEEAGAHPLYRSLARLARLTLEGIKDAASLTPVERRLYR
ncbi:Tat proofreading chaperone DmsD [Eggerthellaceae bacterium zg-1084]|uniref:Tat proofreading chaperone DmsD n=1 Tax=Berryella wangjianweii TaxID=2734634 RepID=UPI0015569AC8|nr:Tat proofreading chaperone DmsD [Berryella wangjianweii]NPD30886.1 Tat proofreading chaperone DmsD [Berryella wangjianweii]